ncbi:MAG: FAD-dependent oxidoreductase, partial [Verrucomicrobiota bacterium]
MTTDNPEQQNSFLNTKRLEMPHRPVGTRIKDFEPVEEILTETELVEQARRCMNCGTPFCHGYGCPLANEIPDINRLVTEQRWTEAAKILLSTNNFPEFTGRICPALCEASCVLDINDEAVSVRAVELAVIEKAFSLGIMEDTGPSEHGGRKVAVIGSGPAGLTVADQLNKAGIQVTVFEKDDEPGGLLFYGIPDFK